MNSDVLYRSRVEEVIRELIQFTKHESTCRAQISWAPPLHSPSPPCTCGLQKVYAAMGAG